jgi:DNA-binding MarR family transcriptional regulator
VTRTQLSQEELQSWYAFLQSHHRVIGQLDAELTAEHGLPLQEYEVLLWLAQSPGRSMKMADLARVVLLSPSGLTRLIDRLVKTGLVERRSSGSDARVMLAHLTEEGLKRFSKAAPTHGRGVKQHFTSKLDSNDLAALSVILEKVIGEAQCPQPPPAVGRSLNGRRRARVTALR